jgi:hypothetical protein
VTAAAREFTSARSCSARRKRNGLDYKEFPPRKAAASESIDLLILANTQIPRNGNEITRRHFRAGASAANSAETFPHADLREPSSCHKNTRNSSGTKFTKRCGFFSTRDETQNAGREEMRGFSPSKAIGVNANSPQARAKEGEGEGEITMEWTGPEWSGGRRRRRRYTRVSEEPSEPLRPPRVRGIAGKWRQGWNGTCFSGGGEARGGEERRGEERRGGAFLAALGE